MKPTKCDFLKCPYCCYKRACSDWEAHLPDVVELYGRLFDLVNIAEHLRGEERIAKIRREAKAIAKRIKE